MKLSWSEDIWRIDLFLSFVNVLLKISDLIFLVIVFLEEVLEFCLSCWMFDLMLEYDGGDFSVCLVLCGEYWIFCFFVSECW